MPVPPRFRRVSSDRRSFLGAVLAAGVVPGLVGGPLSSEDGKSLDRAPDPPEPGPPEQWDVSWSSRLSGPHRGVFDWFDANASAGLWRAGVWKRQVVEAFGVPPEEVGAVLVIRHRAIPMIMSDEFWLRHKLGKARKIKDPMSGKIAERNPYRSSASAEKPPPPEQDFSIEAFLKNGGIVLGCGFAFGFLVSLEATLQGKKPAEVRPDVLRQVIPGIIIQPSGFFALIEAQRSGCGLFPAEGS